MLPKSLLHSNPSPHPDKVDYFEPETKVLKVIPGDGVDVRIAQISLGYSVGVFDSDVDKALGALRIFKTLEAAEVYAASICGSGKTCRDCNKPIEYLADFPGPRCLKCHAAKVERLPLERPNFAKVVNISRVKTSEPA